LEANLVQVREILDSSKLSRARAKGDRSGILIWIRLIDNVRTDLHNLSIDAQVVGSIVIVPLGRDERVAGPRSDSNRSAQDRRFQQFEKVRFSVFNRYLIQAFYRCLDC
jgi:hypothetical protein